MELAETVIHREPWEADNRLAELRLSRKKLLIVREVAVTEAANATPFHPANSAGTFAYHHGTWGLRDQFVGKDWSDGIEAICNETLKIKIAYCNVDVACQDDPQPQPRSRKGAGAERAGGTFLFPELPQYAPRPTGQYALYYLMVDENGAAELSRPALKRGRFSGMVERIYLSYGNDDDGALIFKDDDNGPVDNFDPQIARK